MVNLIKLFLNKLKINQKSSEKILNNKKDISKSFNFYDKLNVNVVNQLVDNVARSRYKNVDYNTINEFAKKILQIPIKKSSNSYFQYKLSQDEAINIALDFFKSIDIEFYEKAKNIIDEKEDNVEINITKSDKKYNDYNSMKKNEPNVQYNSNKKLINIPLRGNVKDVYSIIHEISHLFDFPQNLNISRAILADVNTTCFERMLDCYLRQTYNSNKSLNNDLDIIREESIKKTYFFSLEYIIKYSFLNYRQHNGPLKLNDIKKIISQFNLNPNLVMEYLNDNSQDIIYSARYVLAGLASEEYLISYNQNPTQAIEKLKIYMRLIKENQGREALDKLGVHMDIDRYTKIIEKIYSKDDYNCKTNEEHQQF